MDYIPPQQKPTIRQAVTSLMSSPIRSATRKKAIETIAHKHNITRDEAKFKQAIRIGQSQARRK